MKYSVGDYNIIFFGNYGEKLDKQSAPSFTSAKKIVEKYVHENPEHSAVITRVLWNSKDSNYKWDYSHDEG